VVLVARFSDQPPPPRQQRPTATGPTSLHHCHSLERWERRHV